MPSVVACLRPGGVVAAWTYEIFRATATWTPWWSTSTREVVGPCWPPERRYVEAGYSNLPFPLAEEQRTAFSLVTEWDLDQALGYFASWSAVQRYRDATGADPLPGAAAGARAALARPPVVSNWPMHLRVGRV